MSKYNIFDENIPEDLQEYYEVDKAQTKSLLDASNLIADAMEEKSINQVELAKKLKVSRGYISRILSGNENMSIKNIARVLHILGKEYRQSAPDFVYSDSDSDANILYFEDYSKSNIKIDLTTKVEPLNINTSIWDDEICNG